MATCPKCNYNSDDIGQRCPNCDESYLVYNDAASQADEDSFIGSAIADKYVILGLIDRGGMGAVYEGIQSLVERRVAIKVLRTDLASSENYRSRFLREAKSVSSAQHPNIITLYDFGFESSGNPYMVMEYAPGPNLIEWLRQEHPELEDILEIAKQILSALGEAHDRGIIHRDLKPENLVLQPSTNSEAFVKVLDFGIAKAVNNQTTSQITQEGEVFGTPYYMAPEQCRGELDIGPETDVYAICILLYELICGELPFGGETPLEVAMQHVDKPLPPLEPRFGIRDVPAPLEKIIRKGASKRRTDRFRDATEMLEAIEVGLSSSSNRAAAVRSLHTTTARGMPKTATLDSISIPTTEDQFSLPEDSQTESLDGDRITRDSETRETAETFWNTVRPTLRKTRNYLADHSNLTMAAGLLIAGLIIGNTLDFSAQTDIEIGGSEETKPLDKSTKPQLSPAADQMPDSGTVHSVLGRGKARVYSGIKQAIKMANSKAESIQSETIDAKPSKPEGSREPEREPAEATPKDHSSDEPSTPTQDNSSKSTGEEERSKPSPDPWRLENSAPESNTQPSPDKKRSSDDRGPEPWSP